MTWRKLVISIATVGIIGYSSFLTFEIDSTMTAPSVFVGHVSQSDQQMEHEEEVGELNIFLEVADAHREAILRARAVAPLPVGNHSPVSPGSTQKGEEKRAGIMEALTRQALAEIASAHSMTVENVKQIYRRGKAEGWTR